ncbi:hypothetical protein SlGVgp025 [Spodoptera litura granulovirus]|uniref:Uncharacterized protein n=1 Tax=Spodoptera litura granulovirus TaxID=359919 RepID=A5IZM7_9BBAC|nr:hypothetical protein SlGVgp025 [Spodoptera litura granulovirus]ABQ51968.1 hypothetical protein SlGVgp025 [Spodoptera litura granulovirus]
MSSETFDHQVEQEEVVIQHNEVADEVVQDEVVAVVQDEVVAEVVDEEQHEVEGQDEERHDEEVTTQLPEQIIKRSKNSKRVEPEPESESDDDTPNDVNELKRIVKKLNKKKTTLSQRLSSEHLRRKRIENERDEIAAELENLRSELAKRDELDEENDASEEAVDVDEDQILNPKIAELQQELDEANKKRQKDIVVFKEKYNKALECVNYYKRKLEEKTKEMDECEERWVDTVRQITKYCTCKRVKRS